MLALFVQFVIVLHRHHADAVIMYWFPRVWEGQEGVALDDDRVTKVKRAPCNVWRVTHHDYALFQFLDAARKAASSGGDETAAMDEFEGSGGGAFAQGACLHPCCCRCCCCQCW